MKAKIEKDEQYKAPEFVPLEYKGTAYVYDNNDTADIRTQSETRIFAKHLSLYMIIAIISLIANLHLLIIIVWVWRSAWRATERETGVKYAK